MIDSLEDRLAMYEKAKKKKEVEETDG